MPSTHCVTEPCEPEAPLALGVATAEEARDGDEENVDVEDAAPVPRVAEAVADSVAEAVADSVAEAVADSVAEAVTDSVFERVADSVAEPATAQEARS